MGFNEFVVATFDVDIVCGSLFSIRWVVMQSFLLVKVVILDVSD